MTRARQSARKLSPGLFLLLVLCHALSAHASEPILLRALYQAHFDMIGDGPPVAVATAIDSLNPADGYVAVHHGRWEPVLAELRAQGKLVVRYLNSTTVRPESISQPRPQFERAMAEIFDDGQWLANGQELRYRWYGNPRILRWDTVTSDQIDELVQLYAFMPGDLFEFDVMFRKLRPWMLERFEMSQSELDQLYAGATYLEQHKAFLEAFVENARGVGPRRYFVNSDVDWWLAAGHPVMWENTNRKHTQEKWAEILQQWVACADCVLGLMEPTPTDDVATVWARAVEAVDLWLQVGGILWVGNEELVPGPMHKYALARRVHEYGN